MTIGCSLIFERSLSLGNPTLKSYENITSCLFYSGATTRTCSSCPRAGEQTWILRGNLATGGRIVFFVQGNNALSVYVFDTAVRQADFGGGAIAANGTFALTTQGNRIITGTVSKPLVTAKVNALNVSAI